MTNEKAISILEYIKIHKADPDNEEKAAIELAINALEEAEDWHNLKLVCANDGIVVYKVRDEE